MDSSSSSISSGPPGSVGSTSNEKYRILPGVANRPSHAKGQWDTFESIVDMNLDPEPQTELGLESARQPVPEIEMDLDPRTDSRISSSDPPTSDDEEAQAVSAIAVPIAAPAKPDTTEALRAQLSGTRPSNDYLARLAQIRVQVPQVASPRVSALQRHIDRVTAHSPPFCCSTRALVIIGMTLTAFSVVAFLAATSFKAPGEEVYAPMAPLAVGLLFLTQAALRHALGRLPPMG